MIIEVLDGATLGLLVLAPLSALASICVQTARTRQRLLIVAAALYLGALDCELWLLSLGAGSWGLVALVACLAWACALLAVLERE
jgi:hypothetical protein